MPDGWPVRFHSAVLEKDLPSLSREIQRTILDAIEKKLSSHPDVFGKPLSSGLKGYRKLRVGDYRVVYALAGREVWILVIAHRGDVYDEAFRRHG
jgi:mRNA interferase RelE/StbE